MRTLGTLVALALFGLPRLARAQDALAFTWTAPPSCPARGEVVARVERLRPNLARAASGLSARATVTPAPRGRWRVRIHTEVLGGVGERTLEARTCALLADATAVVLALASDALPDAPPPIDRPSLPASVVQVEDPESPRPPRVVVPPAPRPAPRWFDLGLDVAVSPLTFTGPAVALGLHGAYARGALRVELSAAQQLPTTLAGAREGTGAEVLATFVSARACAMRAAATVSLGACAVLTGGAMWATAFGLQRNDTSAWPWAAAGAGAALRVALGAHLGLIAHVEGVIHLARPRFVVEGVGPTGEVDPFALWASLGVEARWP